jgi:quinol monooxygenase YgiN
LEQCVEAAMAVRKTWQAQGDLVSSHFVRSSNGQEYALVSVWADQAAHNRHEDDPAEQQALQPLLIRLTGRPDEFGGEVVAEL